MDDDEPHIVVFRRGDGEKELAVKSAGRVQQDDVVLHRGTRKECQLFAQRRNWRVTGKLKPEE